MAMDTLGELDVANKRRLADVVDRLSKPDHAAVRADEPVELTCADHEARIVLMHRRHQFEEVALRVGDVYRLERLFTCVFDSGHAA